MACWIKISDYTICYDWNGTGLFFHLIYLVLYFVSLYILIIFLNPGYFEWVLGVPDFALIFFLLFSK